MDTSETYRRILRVLTVVMAVVLVFQSGLFDERTSVLYDQTARYLSASVGMSASVAPNELNAITTALTQQRELLAVREQAVAEREIAIARNGTAESSTELTTYFLAAILFVQLVLIVLNYVLDYLRSRERRFQAVSSEPVGST